MIKARTAIPGWFGVVGGRARLSQKHEESAWTANLNGLPVLVVKTRDPRQRFSRALDGFVPFISHSPHTRTHTDI